MAFVMKKRIPIVLCVLGLFFAACGRSQADAPFAPRPAPAWKLTTLDGHALNSADLAGKVQLINFWATWCPPCNAEIPGLIELQKRHEKDGLVVVGISLDQEGPDVVRQFVAAKKINYAVAMASGGIENAFGKFDGIPTTFIVDRHGNLRAMDIGYASAQEFEDRVKPYLAEK